MSTVTPSKREIREQQLLTAALKVFSRKGYHATQISDIIKSAKSARGTFYLYFKSKREIFARILDFIFSEVRGVVENLPRSKEAVADIPTKVKGNMRRLTELLNRKPEYARVLLCESVSLDPESDKKLLSFYNQLLNLIQSAIKQGQDMGFVRAGNVALLSVELLGMIKEIFYQQILGTVKFETDDVVNELYHAILVSVAKPELLQFVNSGG